MKQIIKDLIDLYDNAPQTLETKSLLYKGYNISVRISSEKSVIEFRKNVYDDNGKYLYALFYNEYCTESEAAIINQAKQNYYARMLEYKMQIAKEELGL